MRSPKPRAPEHTSRWLLAAALTCAITGCGSEAARSSRAPSPGNSTTAASRDAAAAPVETAPQAATRSRPIEDCQALHLAWRRELLVEGEDPDPELLEELDERARKFPCELRVDLDGDAADDRVFITSAGADRSVGIGVEWSDGQVTVLGAGNPVELQPGVEEESDALAVSDFGWLVHWKPAPLRDGGFEIQVLHRTVRFEAPDVIGDGIQISGSDAAAVIYFDGSEWRWIHLGF